MKKKTDFTRLMGFLEYLPETRKKLYISMIRRLNYEKEFIRELFPNTVLFINCPAGYKMHHTEPGGLVRHYVEMLQWMLMNNNKPQLFTDSDIVEAVILHDISKVLLYRHSTPQEERTDGLAFRYIKRERGIAQLNDEFLTLFLINYFELKVSWDVFVAVCFAEGGWSDVSKLQNTQSNKLGYFLHMADLYSSQILGKK
jgi:hypothetical protein